MMTMKVLLAASALTPALLMATAAGAQVATPPQNRGNTTLPDPQTATSPAGDATVTDTAAQPAPTEAMSGEVVVTAQRRSESAQRVPISLVAVSGEMLQQANIKNVLDLGKIAPGFTASRASQAANTRLAIRGIGSSGNTAIEPSVGAFVDGIYIARPGPLLAGLNDIAGVEVLKGPQGTLFGRNASMGAISFHTKLPTDELSAEIGAEYGTYDRFRADAVVNVPLGTAVKARIAGLYEDFNGYGHNLYTGGRYGNSNLKSVRGTVLSELTRALTWTVRGDYQRSRGDGQAVQSVVADTVTPAAAAAYRTRLAGRAPILNDTGTLDAYHYTSGFIIDDQYGVSSDLNLSAGDFGIKLLSAYRNWHNRQNERDVTLTPADLYGRTGDFRSKTHSEELQITSPSDLLNNHLNFVGGLFYYREDYRIGEDLNLGTEYCSLIIAATAPARLAACNAGPKTNAGRFDFRQITESYAGYGQATVRLSDLFDVTGGIRYSHDDKNADLVQQVFNSAATMRAADVARGLKFDGGKVTYRANATLHPTSDAIVFATYSTGYKSGGFDAGNGSTLGLNRVFQPETTENYEIGAKTQWLARKLTLNATLFRTDITNFQLRSFNGVAFSVRNAGSIRQQGVEFEANVRPVRGLSAGIAGTYLDSEYTDFRNAPAIPGRTGTQNLTGRRAPTSPRWQAVASASYTGDLPAPSDMTYTLSSNYSFQTDSDVGGGGDSNPQGIEPGYGLLSARLGIADKGNRWEVFVSGENIADKRYCTLRFSQTLNGPLGVTDTVNGGTVQRCVVGDPRTVRIGTKVKF